MPGSKFTKRASSPKCERQWGHVYASAKSTGSSLGSAIRHASGTLKRNPKCKPAKRGR